MADFETQVAGFQAALARLDQRVESVADMSDDRWLVGTGVEYAVYLEFGTSDMDPKPFVRPALRSIADDVPDIADAADSADEIVARVAFALEREIKKVITAKGLIDTGTLRASIRAIQFGSPSDFPEAEDVDPDATADVEVDV